MNELKPLTFKEFIKPKSFVDYCCFVGFFVSSLIALASSIASLTKEPWYVAFAAFFITQLFVIVLTFIVFKMCQKMRTKTIKTIEETDELIKQINSISDKFQIKRQ